MRTRHRLATIAGATAALLAASVPVARADVIQHLQVPTTITVQIPCANDGAGETVTLSGDLHVLVRFAVTPSGRVHGGSHFQPQGITGVGDTSGDTYHATGVTQDQFNAALGSETTAVNNFRIIGQRTGNNYLVHSVFHTTFNADGSTTAFVDQFSIDCR